MFSWKKLLIGVKYFTCQKNPHDSTKMVPARKLMHTRKRSNSAIFFLLNLDSIIKIMLQCRKESILLVLIISLCCLCICFFPCWSCSEANVSLSRLWVISGLCCSKKRSVMNPFVKALHKYICLDLWSRNVTNATKANEPILCQPKCHSENSSYHTVSQVSHEVK